MRLGQRPRQHIRRLRTNSGRKPTTINKGVKYKSFKSEIIGNPYKPRGGWNIAARITVSDNIKKLNPGIDWSSVENLKFNSQNEAERYIIQRFGSTLLDDIKISYKENEKKRTLSAQEIIKQEYGGSKNFLTPNVIKYGKLDKNTAYELSRGSGFEPGSFMYGVSIAEFDPSTNKTKRSDLSKSFYSKDKANDYIKALKKK